MKVLFIGLGNAGKRHLKNIKEIYPGFELIAYSHRVDCKYDIKTYYNLKEAFDQKPNVTIISTPTDQHIDYAIQAAEHKSHIFLEKPVSNSTEGLEQLMRLVKKNKLICMVGYNLRYMRVIQDIKRIIDSNELGELRYIRAEVGSFFPLWHPEQNYKNDFRCKKEGGGVLLDLSHEIDYVNYFLGGIIDSVYCIYKQISLIKMDAEDIAEITINTPKALASIHLDYFQDPTYRQCRLIFDDGSISYDFQKNVLVIRKGSIEQTKELKSEKDESFKQMIEIFFLCINCRQQPLTNLGDGIKVMKIIEAAKLSSKLKYEVNFV